MIRCIKGVRTVVSTIRTIPQRQLAISTCLRHVAPFSTRGFSTITSVGDGDEDKPSKVDLSQIPGTQQQTDKMILMYTCTVCDTRSARMITKNAYEKGVVLVRCPGCNNLHLIADRLGYFDDNSVDIEAIMAAKGQSVTRRTLPTPTTSTDGAAASSSPGAKLEDPNVFELSDLDVKLLQSKTKSIKVTSGEEVVPKSTPKDD